MVFHGQSSLSESSQIECRLHRWSPYSQSISSNDEFGIYHNLTPPIFMERKSIHVTNGVWSNYE